MSQALDLAFALPLPLFLSFVLPYGYSLSE